MVEFNIDKTVMAIRDYTNGGRFMPFLNGTKPFQIPIGAYKRQPAKGVSGVFWFADTEGKTSNRPTTKMNVSLRGAKGRFVSYKNLPKDFKGLREVIESLPNI